MSHRVVVVGLLAVALAVLPGASTAAESLPIVFSSTLPAWPPPPALNTQSLYSVSAATGDTAVLASARTSREFVDASPAPGGATVAIVREGRVVLVNADGTGGRELFTADAALKETLDGWLAWAPDGKRLAIGLYSTRTCGPSSTKCAIRYIAIVGVDGRRLGTIDSAQNPAWSPDGRFLAVESNALFGLEPEATTIDIVSPEGRTVRTVSRPLRGADDFEDCLAYPAWSPDGGLVVYEEWSCNGEPGGVFHLVRARDGKPVRTANGGIVGWNVRDGLFAYGTAKRFFIARTKDGAVVHSAPGWFVAWGKRPRTFLHLGGVARRPLYRSRLGGRPQRLAASTTGCVSLSPSGGLVFYADETTRHALHTVRVDGRGRRRLAARTTGGYAWPSPDGSTIAFEPRRGSLAVVASGGGTSKTIARLPTTAETGVVAWADNGARLLYTTRTPPLERPALWSLSTDGKAAQRVTRDGVGGAMPSWSPDGTRIAFVYTPAKGTPAGRIATVRADGSDLRTLAVSPGVGVSSPSWSPDGSTIAYACKDDHAICVVGADGRGARTILAPKADPSIGSIYLFGPAWTSDGRWLVYVWGVASGGGSVRAMRPDGTGDRSLLAFGDRTVFRSVAVSPDGATLALSGFTCFTTDPCRRGLWLAGVDGSGLRFVTGTEGGERPRWSPDGRTLVYWAPVGAEGLGRLFTIDTAGGSPRQLTAFDAGAAEPDWR